MTKPYSFDDAVADAHRARLRVRVVEVAVLLLLAGLVWLVLK